jgi:hypothetical protein
VLRARECAPTSFSYDVFTSDSCLNLSRSLGMCHLGTRTKRSEHVSSTCSLQHYYISFNPSAHCPSQCPHCPLHYPYHFFFVEVELSQYMCIAYIIHLIFFVVLLGSPIIHLVVPIVNLSPIHCQINYSHNTFHYLCDAPTIHLVVAIIHLPSNCDFKKNHPPWYPSHRLVPPWSFDSFQIKLPKKRKWL